MDNNPDLAILTKLFNERFPKKINELHSFLMMLTQQDWDPALAHKALKHAQKMLDLTASIALPQAIQARSVIQSVVKALTQALNSTPAQSSQSWDSLIKELAQAYQRLQPNQPLVALKPETSKGPAELLILMQSTELANEIAEQFKYFGYICHILDSLAPLKDPAMLPSSNHGHFAALILDTAFFPDQDQNQLDELHLPWPLIFYATQDDIQTRLFAVRAGGQAFFSQPLEFNSLIEKIDNLLIPNHESPPYRVLIVEDSITQAKIIQQNLEEANIHVELLDDPLQLQNSLSEFQPELILMDLYMPSCTGLELAGVIRQQESFVGIPIVFLSSEKNVGTQLEAMRLGGDDFLTKPISPPHLLSAITTRVERARALRASMIQDSLTGLLNHVRILDQLSIEIARAQREKIPLTFAMIDIDHFKSINDDYGHPSGDRVIKSLARLLKQRLRKTDCIGRYGGEEFAVILPNSDIQSIYPLLEKIRDIFAKIRHTPPTNKFEFSVTFSAGIASLSPKLNSVDALLQGADRALYAAKNQGRNQIIQA